MTKVTAPIGDEALIRAIVFKEGGMYVAQCLEYDIAAQATDISSLLDRLDITVEMEFDACAAAGKEPRECINPAPNYYHKLWETRFINLDRVGVPTPERHHPIEVALAKAA